MKNVWKLICTLMSLCGLAACSDIDESERFVYVPLADVQRHVLIEDFTGQSCVNCPDAAAIIHELQEQYGADVVIAVGVYSGPFGAPQNARDLNLVTSLGTTYWNHWFDNSTPQPIGIINRNGSSSKDEWKRLVSEALSEPTQVTLAAKTAFDVTSRQLDVEVTAVSATPVMGNLQVVLIEDSIQAYQIINGRPDRNYKHNHVLRAAVNGDWGEPVSLGDKPTVYQYQCVLNEAWVADRMQAIVFVTTEDEGVQQVIAVKVNNQ